MSELTERRLPITQIDELWTIAESRWGSAGRRSPPPDPRFVELRQHLGKIEALFNQDRDKDKPLGTKIPKSKIGRKISVDYDDDLDSEIPF